MSVISGSAISGNLISAGTISGAGLLLPSGGGGGGASAPSHRYWRVRTGAGNGDFNLLIGEIEFRETVGGANVALSKTYSDNNNNGAGQTGASAFDADASTVWAQSTKTNNSGNWAKVDFGAAQTVAEFAITSRSLAGFANQAPRLFWCEGSDDDSTWNIYYRAANQGSWGAPETRAFALSSTNLLPAASVASGAARYWRILIDALNGSSIAVVSEIRFLDSSDNELSLYGNISASTTNDPASGTTQQACSMIDGIANNFWASQNGAAVGTTITYDFLVATLPAKLEITARADFNDPTQALKDWRVQSSPDNSTWTTVATITNETGWGLGEVRTYTL